MPVPFDPDEFRGWLEMRTRRRVRLIPAIMEPGGPSGALVCRGDTDYLYYEEQTSPFHQAHIVFCLAARLLLGEGMGAPIDLRLIPGVSPRLVQLMLGQPGGGTVTDAEAEAFAFLALDQVRPACPPVVVFRALRRLGPLRTGVDGPVQKINGFVIEGVRPRARYRLHRQVIGIRDAALALKPYRDPRVASAAAEAARAAGLAGDELAATVEAAVLAAAVRAKAAGHPAHRPAGGVGLLAMGGTDLRSEAGWLVKVSRALTRLQQDAGQVPGGKPGGGLEDSGPASGKQHTWLR